MFIDVPTLLDELCVNMGICLSPLDRSRLSITQYRDVDTFEMAVLEAERLDPLKIDRKMRHDLRETISRYFVS